MMQVTQTFEHEYTNRLPDVSLFMLGKPNITIMCSVTFSIQDQSATKAGT